MGVSRLTPETPVAALQGIGPGRAGRLERLGVRTVRELLTLPPRRYEDRRSFQPIARLRPGELQTVLGTVRTAGVGRTRRGIPYAELVLEDGTGSLPVRFYRQPYLARSFRRGQRLILAGRLAPYPPRELINPEYELLEEGEPGLHTGRIVPVYPLTAGLGQRFLRRLVAGLLEAGPLLLADPLPAAWREARGLPELWPAIREMHAPEELEGAAAGRRRLAFDEFLLFSLALLRQRTARRQAAGIRFAVPGPLAEGVRARLPFRLTGGQTRALEAIWQDMGAPRPMQRLLQGDVGCGKTAVAFLAAVTAVGSGYQAAIMAPTDLLAAQHADRLRALVAPLGIPVVDLHGGMPAAARREALGRLAATAPCLAVGTHALIQPEVRFGRLGLVVVDEQHRFGVLQRAELGRKAEAPDVLVMTATPIPRSLALALYGDLDISLIEELPPGRGRVETRWLADGEAEGVAAALADRLAAGGRAYLVCPVVEESAAELKAAVQTAAAYRRGPLGVFGVGLVHGRQRPAEKLAALDAFRAGRLRLLVSTTVVEVGVDVPEATAMVIEHADRLGLAQLHQLRGRIGRSGRDAVCLVVADRRELGPEARARLEVFVHETDGFALAEADLRLRGPGEFFGTRQAGLDPFRQGSLATDLRLLEEARAAAAQILAESPDLTGRWAALREPLEAAWAGRLGLARVG